MSKRLAPHKGRITVNSRCANLSKHITDLPTLCDEKPVTRRGLLSDTDSDNDAMPPNSEELGARPKTPMARFSPQQGPRRGRSAMSSDGSSNMFLNADGSAPGPSSAPELMETPESASHQTERKNTAQDGVPKRIRRRKKRSRSSTATLQIQHWKRYGLDSDDDDWKDIESVQVIINDDQFRIDAEQIENFRRLVKTIQDRHELDAADLEAAVKESPEPVLPRRIHLGKYIIDSWYGSPFPEEFCRAKLLYICEFCLRAFISEFCMKRHVEKCNTRSPPGEEIYRHDKISVFEVDGHDQKEYCERLCLLARLFLDSKTVFYDTDPFRFYIVTVNSEIGWSFAGYFSKEKYEPDVNNLSCFMILPPYQQRGLGNLLISLSYELSKREGWIGGPEKPLSDLGKAAYGTYWIKTIQRAMARPDVFHLIEEVKKFGVEDLEKIVRIDGEDLLECLLLLGYLEPKGKSVNGVQSMCWNVDWDGCVEAANKPPKPGKHVFRPDMIYWEPKTRSPKDDGFVELTTKQVEEDNEKKKQVPKTPVINSATLEQSTPATSSSRPVGSVKKEVRSRTLSRHANRNLKKDVAKAVTVPDVTSDITDVDEKKEVKKRIRSRKGKRRGRCADTALKTNERRDETPENDGPGPSSKPTGRGRRPAETSKKPAPSKKQEPNTSSKKGRGRKRRNGGEQVEEKKDALQESDSDSSDDDDLPYGSQRRKTKKGKLGKHGKLRKIRQRMQRRRVHKFVAGKKYPPDNGKKEKSTSPSREIEKKERSESESSDLDSERKPGSSKACIDVERMETDQKGTPVEVQSTEVEKELEKEDSDEGGDDLTMEMANDVEEELGRDYIIGTPESYHSEAEDALSPPPAQQFDSVREHVEEHVEENDGAPPLLISEVANLTVSQKDEPRIKESNQVPPPLVQNNMENVGYETEDDDAPPRLSPQYGKQEDHVEEIEKDKDSMLINETMVDGHNGIHQEPSHFHGPTSVMHMTPMQVTPILMSPQTTHPFSHHGPNSLQQQTTPGSGGIPSCGNPVFSHNTPDQQQFMSSMAGIPASVSSVHSVCKSMEMVGGPASLQHTPQQYELGAHTRMSQDSVVAVSTAHIEQQNHLIMHQHGFSSPAAQPTLQQPAPSAQVIPAPVPSNGRRRSAGPRKRAPNPRSRAQQAPAAVPMQQPPMPMPQMPNFQYYPPYGPAYPSMWDGFYYYNQYNQTGMPMQQPMDAATYHRQLMAYQQYQQQTGQIGADGTAVNQFPTPAVAYHQQWFNHQNNMR
ncbi:unnamed protein product [Caenorhabditis sp. 36 PRJEB53466]|nr:unnamed protein product [Caenorhabditis sp. 36 PRJEB53466]